jgi:hypothetical protein
MKGNTIEARHAGSRQPKASLRFLLRGLMLALAVPLWASDSYRDGMVIAKFRNASSIEAAQSSVNATKYHPLHLLDPSSSIFRIDFDSTIPVDSAIAELTANQAIDWVMPNFVGGPRMVPSDPLWSYEFHSPWSEAEYMNLMGAPEVWDVTTGGTTFDGQQIVIAVCDAVGPGSSIELDDNLWTNPVDNSMDNNDQDHNTYVDDVHGWNCADPPGDGNILVTGTGSFHTRKVASVCDAVANNGCGMAGVAWDAKLMYLNLTGFDCGLYCYDFESTILAKEYLIRMKQAWRDSRGAQGANIVVALWPWGLRDVLDCREQQYQGWVDLFDELGQAGILSVCAASNLAPDEDIEGDIPSGCPSDYIVCVTGFDWFRSEFPPTAPTGATTVDLGAPSMPIYALTNANGDQCPGCSFEDCNQLFTYAYGEMLSGNSVASAWVAGQIALLMGVPQPAFCEYFREYPASAALELKNIVLEHARAVPAYQGTTVSGGVADLAQSVEAMSDFYGATIYGLHSVMPEATSGSAGCNFAESSRGRHEVHMEVDGVVYSWLPSGETSPSGWRSYKISGESANAPSIAVREWQGESHVFVCWRDGLSHVKFVEHEISGMQGSFHSSWTRPTDLALPVSGNSVITAPPVLVPEADFPTIFVGAYSPGDLQHSGLYCLSHMMTVPIAEWSTQLLAPTAGSRVKSASAISFGDNHGVGCAYVRDTSPSDDPWFIWGERDAQLPQYNFALANNWWLGPVPVNYTDLDNIGVAFGSLFCGVAAWDGLNTSTGKRDILYHPANTFVWGNPFAGESVGVLGDGCNDFRAPSLWATAGANFSWRKSPVCMAYHRSVPNDSRIRVEYRGYPSLQLEVPQDWAWSGPFFVGWGRYPSVWKATDAAGYRIMYTGDAPSPPFDIMIKTTIPQESEPIDPDYAILSNETWTGPVGLLRPVQIAAGGHLTVNLAEIECGADGGIDALPGTGIVVQAGGSLTISGSETTQLLVRGDAAEAWSGITCSGQLNMSYVDMRDCEDHCIYLYKPDVGATIDNCTFDGSKIGPEGDVIRIVGSPENGNTIINSRVMNVPEGRGVYLNDCKVKFDGVDVADCSYWNTYLYKVTGQFLNCRFTGHSGKGFQFASAGCSPNFKCCYFDDVSDGTGQHYSIWCSPSVAPTFGWEGAQEGVSNVFSDTSATLFSFYQSKTVNPIIDNIDGKGAGGHNDWYQRNRYGFFLSKAATVNSAFAAQGQYWNRDEKTITPDITCFSPSLPNEFDYSGDQQSPWDLCGGSESSIALDPSQRGRDGGLDDGPTELDSLFGVGLQLESTEEYELAQSQFHSIALLSADPELRWQATTHVVSTQRHLDRAAGETWIPNLIDSDVAADSARYASYVYGKRLLASYRTDREEYEAAISLYASLLEYGLTTDDSLLVALDLTAIQLLMDEGGGHLDAATGIPAALRVRSHAEAFANEKRLLDQFHALHSVDRYAPAVPVAYRLYQNFPNPFNPTTEIVFDLPVTSNVKLQVFNTLGQLVTTVVNEARAAGQYKIHWDASDLASGLYIYRIEANGFVDAKKMVLLR